MNVFNAFSFLLVVVAGPIYFLPTIIALAAKRNHSLGIFLLNLFLGLTFLGWIGALIWACVKDPPQAATAAAASSGYHGKYKGYPYRYLDEGRIEFMTASGPRTAPSWAAFAEAADAATGSAGPKS